VGAGAGFEGALAQADLPESGPLAPLARAIAWLNRGVIVLGMLALLGAALILAAAVFLRYFLHQPTDWQDEVAVFLLVGAIFLCSGYVQERRGHIGIEALATLLPARVNHVRRILVDLASFLFCAFFTWKCLGLLAEAYTEGQTTESSWGPPLAIPYGLMAAGMVLLTLVLFLQALRALIGGQGESGR